MNWRFRATLLAVSAALLWGHVLAAQEVMIVGTNAAGVSQELAVNRYPGLYTGNFGDCLGGQSLFNVTRFDAAYYADNMTVLFHIDGSTSIKNESLMMHISVSAYGESRFNMTFDPCMVNIYSLCPLNASVPITGWATFPVGPEQVGGIPPIALTLPDLEGYAKLQIFANSTQTEIGCFQSVMTNGNTFAQSEALSPVFAFFAAIAILSSFLPAAYGVSIPHMRTHFAHSLSVFVVFETFQSFFLSGALALQWPSMLVSWWSNFAWACGLIYTSSLVNGINHFAGVRGNGSQVGGAGSTVIDNGGGLAAQIYGRGLKSNWVKRAARPTLLGRSAASYNSSDPYDYTWAGVPVSPGLPLPGTWNGFEGDLSSINIAEADAFLVALIWVAVAVALLLCSVLVFKGLLELLARRKWMPQDRFAYFRSHYRSYAGLAVLRMLYIAFFAMMTLALIQLTLKGAPVGPIAIAAIVFFVFVVGVGGVIGYACYNRLHDGRYTVESDRIVFASTKFIRIIPVIMPTRNSTLTTRQLSPKRFGSVPFFRIRFVDNDTTRPAVHQDEAYVKRFGWLSARFRRTRWWFFSFYFTYQFIRALFIGGAGSSPTAQVVGLFVVEIIAFVVIVKLSPFEGARNTAIAVWMLSISKVVTAGVSIAFLPHFNLDRIIATVLGVLIIIVQGFVVIALCILIVLGAISSYMSLTRNREEFWPESLEPYRVKFFENLQAKAPDRPAPPRLSRAEEKKKKAEEEEEKAAQAPKEPYFSVKSVRRAPKIEDEDGDVVADLEAAAPHNGSVIFHQHPERAASRMSRPNSISSRYSMGGLPRAARAHRASWSSRDFAAWEGQMERPDSALAHRLSSSSINVLAAATAGGGDVSARTSASKSLAPLVILPADKAEEEENPGEGAGPASAGVGAGARAATPSSPLPTSPRSPTGVIMPAPTREVLARHADERGTKPPPADVIADIDKAEPRIE